MLRIKRARRTILLALVAVLVVVLAAGCGSKKEETESAGKVIATYKDGTVTDTEFSKYSAFFGIVQPQYEAFLSIPEYQEQILREYIGYKILYKPLEDKKLSDADQKDQDTFYTQLKEHLDSDADTKKKADDAGLKEADFRHFYSLLTEVSKDELSKVTDDEVKKQFDGEKDDYNVVSVRHILVATVDQTTGAETRKDEDALKIAKEVKAKLDAGGDWTALAKQYSDDPGSKDNGGLYADQQAKGWVAEFKKAANTQAIGVVGDPVKSDYGYHVMKVEKRTPTAFDKLSDTDKDGLKQEVASAKLQAFMTNDLPGMITNVSLPKTADTTGTGTNAGTGTTNSGTTNSGTKNSGTTNSGTTNTGSKNNATTNNSTTESK